MAKYEAGLDGVTFQSHGSRLLGGFYKAKGNSPRPTAILLHGLPGIEKHLDVAYCLRDDGWNCLYFHFRGCWGSHGSYSLEGLVDDIGAAVNWIFQQPSVDPSRVVLIGGSTMGHTALLYGASDPRISAMIGISPVVNPAAFHFSQELAQEFAEMLSGVTGPELIDQWNALPSLSASMQLLKGRPILMITADQDTLFPPSHYTEFMAENPEVEWVRNKDADHSFSTSRTWLVQRISEWLLKKFGE